MFWEHIEFQDRTVGIWRAIAERYKGNTWVCMDLDVVMFVPRIDERYMIGSG